VARAQRRRAIRVCHSPSTVLSKHVHIYRHLFIFIRHMQATTFVGAEKSLLCARPKARESKVGRCGAFFFFFFCSKTLTTSRKTEYLRLPRARLFALHAEICIISRAASVAALISKRPRCEKILQRAWSRGIYIGGRCWERWRTSVGRLHFEYRVAALFSKPSFADSWRKFFLFPLHSLSAS
jgi:hypothetical protein